MAQEDYRDKIYNAVNSAYRESGFKLTSEEFKKKLDTDPSYKDKIYNAVNSAYKESGFKLTQEEFSSKISLPKPSTSKSEIPTVTVKGDSVYTDKGVAIGESPKPIEFPAKELKAFSDGLMKLPANIFNKPENRNIYYNTFSEKRNLNPNLVKQVGEEIARSNSQKYKLEIPTDFKQQKDNTFVESSIAFNPKNKFTIEAVEDVEGGIPRTKLVANAENFPTKFSKTEVEPTVDGILDALEVNSPLFAVYRKYSLEPALGMIEEGQKKRWKSAFVDNKAKGVLKELVGDGFVAMGVLGLAHPQGFAAFTAAMEYIPGAEMVAMLPTYLKEQYKKNGVALPDNVVSLFPSRVKEIFQEKKMEVPDWIDDAAAVADLLWMGKVAKVASGKYEGYKAGKDFLQSIKDATPEEMRAYSDAIQEKRLELGEEGYKKYVESKITRDVMKVTDVTREIEAVDNGMGDYNPPPTPTTLQSLGSSADVMYKGEVGRAERRSSGDWYFVNAEGKSTQIKIGNKTNPTESLAELDIQVLPDVPESVIAKARANSELTDNFDFNNEKYFVSVDRLPNGEVEALVFNVMPDGRFKNVLDNAMNPEFGRQMKLDIVNDFLSKNNKPNVTELKPTTKTQENAIQKPSTTEEVSPIAKGGENIPEGGEGIRQGKQGEEVTQEVAKEEVGGEVNFTEVENKKIKDIAIEANLKVGSYVKSVPTGKKNKFGNSINEYEATNPFTNEKITFKKQGDATDYVVKEIAKANTKSGREEIFKAVEQSLKEIPQEEVGGGDVEIRNIADKFEEKYNELGNTKEFEKWLIGEDGYGGFLAEGNNREVFNKIPEKWQEQMWEGDFTAVKKRYSKVVEQPLKEIPKEEVVPALANVESTTKALDELANDNPDGHSKLEEQAGVMYHGTEAVFDKFDRVGEKIPSLGLGYYFTPTLQKAKQYGSKIKKIVLEGAKILNWNKLSDIERGQIKKRLEERMPSSLLNGLGETKTKTFNLDTQRQESLAFYEQKVKETEGYEYDRGKARVSRPDKDNNITITWKERGLDVNDTELLGFAQRFDNNIANSMGYDAAKYGNEIAVFNGEKIKNATNEVISEAYHKAKADGSNPELVKAVEDSLTPKNKNYVKENGVQKGRNDGNENVPENVQGDGKKGGQEVNKQKEKEKVTPSEQVVTVETPKAETVTTEPKAEEFTDEEIQAAYEERDAELKRLKNTEGEDYIQEILRENLGKIHKDDYARYGDGKFLAGLNRSDRMKYNRWFNNDRKAEPLDAKLQELSERFGVEITPQMAIEFFNERIANPTKFRDIVADQKAAKKAAKKSAKQVAKEASQIPNELEDVLSTYFEGKEDAITIEDVEKLRGFPMSEMDANLVIEYLKAKENEKINITENKGAQGDGVINPKSERVEGESGKDRLQEVNKKIAQINKALDTKNAEKQGNLLGEGVEQTMFDDTAELRKEKVALEKEKATLAEVKEPTDISERQTTIEAEKTEVQSALDEYKAAKEARKKLGSSQNLGIKGDALTEAQGREIAALIKIAKALIKEGVSTAADMATRMKEPLTEEMRQAYRLAKKNIELTDDIVTKIAPDFGKEISGLRSEVLNSTDKKYAEGLTNEQRLEAAKVEFEKAPIEFEERNDTLTKEVLETGISDLKVSINQQAEYLVHIRNIDNKISALENDAAAAYKRGDNATGNSIEQTIDFYNEARADINEAALKIGSSKGASLQFVKAIISRDFNIVADKKFLESKTGAKLSPEQEAQFEAIKKRSKELTDEIIELNKKLAENETQDAINAIKEDLAPKKTQKQGIKDELKEKIAARKVRKKELFDGLRKDYFQVLNESTRLLKMFGDKRVIELGKLILEDAADYASFSAEMVKEFGKDVKDLLPDFYKNVGGKEEAVLPSINAKGELQISEQTLRNLVAEGFDTPEKLTDKLYDLISPDLPSVDKAQIELAYSRYGKETGKGRDDIGRKLSEIKQTKKLMLALEDLLKGNLPKRSGMKREPLTPEQRKLTQEIRARTKDLPLSVEESNRLYASALDTAKRRMQNRIEDLREQIDTKTKRLRAKNVLELDVDGKKLEAELKDVQQEFNDIFGKNELTNEQKVDRALKALEERIDAAENALSKGGQSSKIKAEPPTSDAIKAAKMYIDFLKEAQAEVDAASGLAQAKAEVAKIKLLDSQIKKYQDRTKTRDFIPKVKKELPYVEEIAKKERELEEEKFKYLVEKEKFLIENQTKGEKAKSLMYDILNSARSIMASYDLSAAGRQGAYYLPTYPRIFAKAYKGMLQDIRSDVAHNNYKYNLKSGRYYKVMKESGLFIADTNSALKAKEEMFTGDIFNRIEKLRKDAEGQGAVAFELKALLKANQLIAGGINASERAYVGFLNRLRTQIFTENAKLINSGIRFDANLFGKKIGVQITKPSFAKENFKILADIINQGTGRGSITKGAEPLMKVLNWGAFSARFTISRFTTALKTLIHAANPVNKISATTRLILLKDLSTFVAANQAFLYLVKNIFKDDKNVSVGTNPYDSDTYGSINVNGTNYAIWGGMNKSYSFAAQMFHHRRDYGSVRNYEAKRRDMLDNYFGNKLAPIPGFIYHWKGTGKNYRGEEFDPLKEAPKLLMPMTLSQALDSKNTTALTLFNSAVTASGFDAAERLADPEYSAKRIDKQPNAKNRVLMLSDLYKKFTDKEITQLIDNLTIDGGLLGKDDFDMLIKKFRQEGKESKEITKIIELKNRYNSKINKEEGEAANVKKRGEGLDKFFEVYKSDPDEAFGVHAGKLKNVTVDEFSNVKQGKNNKAEREFIDAIKRAYPTLDSGELRKKYNALVEEYKTKELIID